MNYLQKEFEATGHAAWINSDIYPDGKIYTKEYTEWLEGLVMESRQNKQAHRFPCPKWDTCNNSGKNQYCDFDTFTEIDCYKSKQEPE